jgi:hypothetical protein
MKEWLGILLIGGMVLILSVFCLVKPAQEYSKSERRKLAQFPEWSLQLFMENGMNDKFELYSMDQFPLREEFRKIKSIIQYFIIAQRDNHGIYLAQDHAAELVYPINLDSIRYAMERFKRIYETYLEGKDIKIYSTVVPDKSYFLAKENGYLVIDYEEMFQEVKKSMPYSMYMDLTSYLDISDYYKTDSHWKQEELLPLVEKIADYMGFKSTISRNYQKINTNVPFYGVYYGQSALSLKNDEISYITNDIIEDCTVYNYETNLYTKIYDMEKLKGDDSYEVFLSGATPLLTINNPNAKTDKELIIFRDSFGSSLAPLLVEGYKNITLVDIRYMSSESLQEYIEIKNQDVLFMYSTLVLNNSYSLK